MASAAKVNLPAPATWVPGRQKNSMILVDPEGFNMRYNTVEGTKKYYCLIQEGQDLQLPCLWPRGHGAWQHYGHESLLTLSPTWHTFSLGTQSHLALGLLGTQSHLAFGLLGTQSPWHSIFWYSVATSNYVISQSQWSIRVPLHYGTNYSFIISNFMKLRNNCLPYYLLCHSLLPISPEMTGEE